MEIRDSISSRLLTISHSVNTNYTRLFPFSIYTSSIHVHKVNNLLIFPVEVSVPSTTNLT